MLSGRALKVSLNICNMIRCKKKKKLLIIWWRADCVDFLPKSLGIVTDFKGMHFSKLINIKITESVSSLWLSDVLIPRMPSFSSYAGEAREVESLYLHWVEWSPLILVSSLRWPLAPASRPRWWSSAGCDWWTGTASSGRPPPSHSGWAPTAATFPSLSYPYGPWGFYWSETITRKNSCQHIHVNKQ